MKSLTTKAQRYRLAKLPLRLLSIDAREAHLYSESRNVILDEKGEFRSELIPGFSIRLGELFDRV